MCLGGKPGTVSCVICAVMCVCGSAYYSRYVVNGMSAMAVY